MSKKTSTYSLPVRIAALALTVLVASGAVTYLVTLLIDLLG